MAILGLAFGLQSLVPGSGETGAGRRLRSRLIAEVGPARPLEARLAGLDHASIGTRHSVSKPVRKIAREVEEIAERERSPEALGALALLQLLGDRDRPARLRKAIELLEQATALPGGGAHLWSDLAAVCLESAHQGEPWLYVRALEAAWHAVEADPDLPEARYNLALALQKNFLVEEASEAWGRYERMERDRAWRGETAALRKALGTPTRAARWKRRSRELEAAAVSGDLATVSEIVAEDPFRSRRHLEVVLLPDWAEAHVRGLGSQAGQRLQAARRIGAVLATERSEHMAEDSVMAIDRLIRSGDDELLAALAASYGDLDRGANLCVDNQGTLGEMLLASARDVFERARSPISDWIDYHLAVCAYQRSAWRRSIDLLRKILGNPAIGRYPSLAGRAHWMIGLSHMMLGEPAAASEAYESSLAVLNRTGALPEIAGIDHLLAENRAFLGDRRQAWVFLYDGLGLAVADGDPRRLYTGLDKTADAAALEGRTAAAMFFRSALVREALAQGDDPGVAHAFLRRAETHLQSGRRNAAQSDLDRAKDSCARIADPDEHRRREADIFLAEGKLLSFDQPEAALSPLGRALEIYRAIGNRYPLVGAHLARARALLASGQADMAQQDVLAGIEEFERQRGEIQSEALRIAHFDQARELFDLLIDLQGKGSGIVAAFNSVEQMRARVLLDRAMGGRAARPLALREILARLPSGVSVIAYASLPERLLVWVLRKGTKPTMTEIPVAARRLEDLVSACQLDIQRQAEDESAPSCLVDLQEMVLSRVLSQVPAEDRIVFVPDRSLHRLPFAALRDRKTGRFLVEDHASAVTPNASLYVEGKAPASMGAPSLLVVADPRFDRARFDDLASLDGALKEAGQIAGLFGDRALVLKEESATREAFLREVGEHSIVHLGTHTVLNPDHPHLSQLLLAPVGDGDSGTLTAAEIESLSLPKTRLVYLASCRSGGGALASEGVLSMARSFLAAGVPEVVASLWDLDDGPAGALTLDFYDRLRAGADAQEALRQTQLKVLAEPREEQGALRVWAALQVVVTWKHQQRR